MAEAAAIVYKRNSISGKTQKNAKMSEQTGRAIWRGVFKLAAKCFLKWSSESKPYGCDFHSYVILFLRTNKNDVLFFTPLYWVKMVGDGGTFGSENVNYYYVLCCLHGATREKKNEKWKNNANIEMEFCFKRME